MDIKQLEEMFEPSAMKMARENQARLDSLHLATGSIDGLLKIAHDLDPIKKLSTHTATQDLLSQLSQAFPHNNFAIDSSLLGIVRSLAESNSLNLSVFESIKFNKAIIDAFEATHSGLKPRTQFIFPEGFTSKSQIGDLSSVISKATKAFKQYEKFSELESFKAISRLENFPNDKVWTQNYYEAPEITEDSLAEAKNIDAMISDEVSSVDDFNDLTESSQRSLEELNLSCYQIFIIHYIYIITILRDQISNSLKYSNMEFKFVGLSSKVLVGVCFIGFQPDFNSICNSILATILLESIKKDEEK